MNSATASLLLVDDDLVDLEAMRRAFRRAGAARPLAAARDGIEALEFLRGRGAGILDQPMVLVLDLVMPRMGGLELLRELRRDPALATLCVFVMSTSDETRHKEAVYRQHAAGYLVKTADPERLTEIARLLDLYCRLVELPAA